MLLAARSAFMAQKKKLPFDSAVAYLESTGTQWIDTGVNATSELGYSVTCSRTSSSTQRCGAIQLTGTIVRHHFSFPESSSALTVCGYGTDTSLQYGTLDNKTHVLEFSSNIFCLDGTQRKVFNQTTFDLQMPFLLFARKSDQGITPALIRIYEANITVNGLLVRNFQPVRIGTTGYMYDKVSKQLFGNKGTGNFLYGKDVKVKL